jgi:hypothetical protein
MFAHALDRTLVAIRQPGRTIHIVSGVPEARYHIPFSLARSTLLLGPHAGAIQPRRSDVETRQKMTLQAFARVAVEDDIRMVPMHDILCDSQACQIASQGRSLYRDADHLSAFGASVIEKPAFEPAFRTMEGAAK